MKFDEIKPSDEYIDKIDVLDSDQLGDGVRKLLAVALTKLTLSMQSDPELTNKQVSMLKNLTESYTKIEKLEIDKMVFSEKHSTVITVEDKKALLISLFKEFGPEAVKLLEEGLE